MTDLIAEIKTLAPTMTEALRAWRREFHQYPELSHAEARTAATVAAALRDLGLTVKTGLAGHGVVGELIGGRPGRTVAWRADMDALPLTEKVEVPWRSLNPGVMHACGHDVHMAIGLGAAKLLSRLRDRLAGRYRFIFQPAEEGPLQPGGGAQGMVAAGALDDPPVAAICALHVAPNVEVGHIRHLNDVVMAGADRIVLNVIGKAAHGATPHRGVDAILVAAQALNLIQAHLAQRKDARHPVVLTFGVIQGGVRFNILAEQVTLEGSLRCLQDAVRQELIGGLRQLLDGLGRATGARLELTVEPTYPVLKNDPGLGKRAVAVLQDILGKAQTKPHPPAMGSEDFAFYTDKAPAFYFFLGVRPPGGKGQTLHSPQFNPDEGALPVGLLAAAGLLASLAEPEAESR